MVYPVSAGERPAAAHLLTDYFPVQHEPIDVCNGDGMCLLLSRNVLFVYSLYECRPVTAEARPRSLASPCENCGGQSVKGTGVSRNNSAFSYQ